MQFDAVCHSVFTFSQHAATHHNTLQHTTTHCNTLQHNVTLSLSLSVYQSVCLFLSLSHSRSLSLFLFLSLSETHLSARHGQHGLVQPPCAPPTTCGTTHLSQNRSLLQMCRSVLHCVEVHCSADDLRYDIYAQNGSRINQK